MSLTGGINVYLVDDKTGNEMELEVEVDDSFNEFGVTCAGCGWKDSDPFDHDTVHKNWRTSFGWADRREGESFIRWFIRLMAWMETGVAN